MLVIGAVAAVLAVGGQVVWRAVRSHPHFTLRNVDLVGAETLAATDIRDIAGLVAGVSTWDVHPEVVRERILRHPWVANVRVRRRLPDSLLVAVREHRAVATVGLAGASYAVDRRGRIFAPLSAEAAAGLPRIIGIEAAQLSGGDRRTVGTLRQACALIRILSRHHRVAEVHVDTALGMTARAADLLAVPIHFGWGDWKSKRRRLDTVLALWSGREGQLGAVSLAFGDQVIVRLRKGIDASEHDV